MSGNDKTREKLMESMRMTKADSAKKTEAVEPAQALKPQDDKPVQKTKKTATKKTTKNTQNTNVDPYQRGRRIWPD